MSEMNAIVVEKYGGIENLVHKLVPKPTKLEEYDILVQYVPLCPYPRSCASKLIDPQGESYQR